jgi:ATP-binding protein involved in chromosome partitioning
MKNYLVLAVCSGKGGVGKSTIAFSLAKLLSRANYKVGLVDVDIYGPSCHLLFQDMGVLKPVNNGPLVNPPCVEKIWFMSAAFLAPGGAFIRAPKATAIAKSFFESADWGDIDILVVDFPPGTGDVALSLFQEVYFDSALLITTPHTLSVEDTAKSAGLILKSGIPIAGIIENMSYLKVQDKILYPLGFGGGSELGQLLNLPLLASIAIHDQSKGSCVESIIENLEPVKKDIKILIDRKRLEKSLCSL